MQKFLLNIIAFSGLALLTYPVAIFLSGVLLPQMFRPNLVYPLGWKGHLQSRVEDIAGEVDVLVIGSSHAYRGFDPRIFQEAGLKMFNLGSSGQTPETAQPLLKRYLSVLKPKLVIYVTSAGSFYTDGVESSLDIIANDKIDIHTASMALKVNHLKTYNTLIYGFVRKILGLDNDFREEVEKEGERYISGGYVEREEHFDMLKDIEPFTWKWNQNQFDALGENLALIHEQGSRIVLVQTPITESYYNAFKNKEEFDNLISVYGEYYNFNGKVDLVDTIHFYDGHHLNKQGVELFNRAFLQQVTIIE